MNTDIRGLGSSWHESFDITKARLVLGGGDGMAVRETLRWAEVETITLVDLDPMMTEMFTDHPDLSALNDFALRNARVETINADAFHWCVILKGTPMMSSLLIFQIPIILRSANSILICFTAC